MQRTVTVLGRGTAATAPDSAVVNVGASHRARTVADAVAGVDSAVAAIGRVARGLTEASAVGTTGLQVWAGHDQDGRPDGFEASHQLRIACPNLPVASALVVGLVEEVGDRLRIEGVHLEVSDPSSALDAAREAAYEDARRRAHHLAGLAGLGLGDLLGVEEEPDGGPSVQGGAVRSLAVGIEPGETTVTSAVRATWQLV